MLQFLCESALLLLTNTTSFVLRNRLLLDDVSRRTQIIRESAAPVSLEVESSSWLIEADPAAGPGPDLLPELVQHQPSL